MQKRICPHCFGRWYSCDSSRVWKCETCGHDIPVPNDMKSQVVISIPYRSFKERIRLTKKYEKLRAKITVYDDYLLIEGTCLL